MTTAYVTLSTPWGEGGINIIELIGPRAQDFISEVFKPKHVSLSDKLEPNRLYLGYVYDKDQAIDEVIINFIPAQESFTGLDTVEINSHGGIMPAQKIMTLLKARGVKGITTSQLRQLALKHKRLDVIQSEALEALQSAPTFLVAQVLLDQYNGALSREVKQIFTPLEISRPPPNPVVPPQWASLAKGGAPHQGWYQACLAGRRASLAKGGRRLPSNTVRGSLTGQDALLNKLTKLLNSARFGLALTNPGRIVIGGLPNVGKSTLFNALVGQERVIIHHLPGTTRDVVEELISIQGIPFSLRDTAGLDDVRRIKTSNQLEKKEGRLLGDLPASPAGGPMRQGIKKAKSQIKTADLTILLLDRSQPLPGQIKQVMKLLNNRLVLYVLNKNDLPQQLNWNKVDLIKCQPLSVSALHQRGLKQLRQSILDSLQLTPDFNEPGKAVVFTKRQYDLLKEVYQVIANAKTNRSFSLAITRVRSKLEKLTGT